MEATSPGVQDSERADSVRRYFAKLSLRAQPDAIAHGWPRLPVESYFVALRLPLRLINSERRPAGEAVESLGSLFASVRWS